MLAEREERDRPLHDLVHVAAEPALALRGEHGEQLGVALVALGRIEERPDEPVRRIARPRRIEAHAERREHLGGVALKALPLLRADLAAPNELGRSDVVLVQENVPVLQGAIAYVRHRSLRRHRQH